ncbi:MAG: hypothetical protein ABFS17_09285 [Chloroflexota bacterium]
MDPTINLVSYLRKTPKLIAIMIILGLCWLGIPMQLRGTPQDDFKAFVYDPIPDSVQNIEVIDNDLIVLPDRTYCFRFNILPEDLNMIITVNQLKLIEEDVAGIQSYNVDIEDWEEEMSHTIFDYYRYSDSDERPQEIYQLWVDEFNNKVIYCYSSL